MNERKHYLVWKETVDLFSAQDAEIGRMTLTTWKKTTGKPIKIRKMDRKCGFDEYEIFQPHPEEQSYLRNYFGDRQLLVKCQPE